MANDILSQYREMMSRRDSNPKDGTTYDNVLDSFAQGQAPDIAPVQEPMMSQMLPDQMAELANKPQVAMAQPIPEPPKAEIQVNQEAAKIIPPPPPPKKELTPEEKIDEDLAEERRNKRIMDALAMMNRGFGQAAAGYAGGNIAQLKADNTASEMLEKMGAEKVSDAQAKLKAKREKLLEDSKRFREDAELKIKQGELKLKQDEMNAKQATAASTLKLTPAQMQADKAYGKEYQKWATAGGREMFAQKLQELDDVQAELLKGEVMTSGPIAGNLPRILNRKAADMKDKMDRIIVDTLRPTLGAQFTQQEGEAIKKLSYDPTAEQDSNLKKIEALKQQLLTKMNQNDMVASHYEDKGTLSDFKPTQQAKEQQSPPSSKAPYGEEVTKDGKTYKWNSGVGKYQLK